MKKYFIRIYIFDDIIGLLINESIECSMLALKNSFDGINGLLAIYDVECSKMALMELIKMGVTYMPLNNFGDFVITCPKCGKRIDDDMILKIYNEEVLSGYNIICNRENCGFQKAKVRYLG